MKLTVKNFYELNIEELYEILRVRSEVFVVEQTCIYQDIDGIDKNSLHMYFMEDGEIPAYLRVFFIEEGVVQIGRVLTTKRGVGLGGELLAKSLIAIKERMAPSKIYLEAQCYATGFYEREGFKIVSEEFLEDGIPHVAMEKMIEGD